jgi:hypothetical protein
MASLSACVVANFLFFKITRSDVFKTCFGIELVLVGPEAAGLLCCSVPRPTGLVLGGVGRFSFFDFWRALVNFPTFYLFPFLLFVSHRPRAMLARDTEFAEFWYFLFAFC